MINELQEDMHNIEMDNIEDDNNDLLSTPNDGNGVMEDFIEPLNPTDAYVFHDPVDEIMRQKVIGVYLDNDPERFGPIDEQKRPTNQYVPLTSGKFEPLLEVCDTRITADQIDKLEFFYTDFAPSIRVSVNVKGFRNNIPVAGDTMTVVFVPTIEKTFRNISVTFLISDVKEISNDFVLYYGEYKCTPLKQSKMMTIKTNDCKECGITQNNHPNMFELLHEIALQSGFGFAATDNCKNLNDRNVRHTKGATFYDYINDMIKCGGENENSVLDCWIDLYGYITLVNLSYIFNSEYDYRHYVMRSAIGSEFTASNMPQQQAVLCNRVLTNFRSTSANSNIEIESAIEHISDPMSLMNQGNLMTFWCMDSQDIGGNESMTPYDIETTPLDVSHKRINEYATNPKSEIIFNNNEFYNPNLQSKIRDFYISNKQSKKIKVCLRKLNFAIQRGTLVQLALYEDNPTQKTKMIYNIKNAIKQYESLYGEKIMSIGSQTSFADSYEEQMNKDATDLVLEDVNYDVDDLKPTHLPSFDTDMGTVSERELLSTHAQIPNWYESGLYYVAGMEFKYKANEEIKQYLYLIKKDMSLKINDRYLPMHYDADVY